MKTRLQYFCEAWQPLDEAVFFPADVAKIKEAIPEIAEMPDTQVDDLYSDYCNGKWCAGWMDPNDYEIDSFKRWIFGEPWGPDEIYYYIPDWIPPFGSKEKKEK